jgi:hypothetical protein
MDKKTNSPDGALPLYRKQAEFLKLTQAKKFLKINLALEDLIAKNKFVVPGRTVCLPTFLD